MYSIDMIRLLNAISESHRLASYRPITERGFIISIATENITEQHMYDLETMLIEKLNCIYSISTYKHYNMKYSPGLFDITFANEVGKRFDRDYFIRKTRNEILLMTVAYSTEEERPSWYYTGQYEDDDLTPNMRKTAEEKENINQAVDSIEFLEYLLKFNTEETKDESNIQ